MLVNRSYSERSIRAANVTKQQIRFHAWPITQSQPLVAISGQRLFEIRNDLIASFTPLPPAPFMAPTPPQAPPLAFPTMPSLIISPISPSGLTIDKLPLMKVGRSKSYYVKSISWIKKRITQLFVMSEDCTLRVSTLHICHNSNKLYNHMLVRWQYLVLSSCLFYFKGNIALILKQ